MPQRRFAITVIVKAALMTTLLAGAASAQVDIAGNWRDTFYEDQPERIMPGPDVGDYLGLPLTPGARLRALSWDASILSLPTHQALPHPSPYSIRGPANLSITKEIDPSTLRLIAYHVAGTFGRADRTIWMDGRPRPSDDAPHTWAGFSLGRFEGNTLVVTTTHIKEGWLRRNGVNHSDRVRLSEHWIRHGSILTVMSVVYDDATLTEPLVRTTDFVWNATPATGGAGTGAFEIVDEIAGHGPGYVPHHLPGLNEQAKDFADREGIPLFATMGYAENMYPEFIQKLVGPRKEYAAKVAADIAAARKVDPIIGTWKLDVAKSTFEGPPPYARQFTLRPVGDRIRGTEDTNVDAQAGAGEGRAPSTVPAPRDRQRVEYVFRIDGKEYPISGGAVDTVSFRRVDPLTVERSGKRNGKVIETVTLAESRDGRNMTVTTTGTRPDGSQYKRSEMYFRQDGGRMAGGR